jgi:hypothetical protein
MNGVTYLGLSEIIGFSTAKEELLGHFFEVSVNE